MTSVRLERLRKKVKRQIGATEKEFQKLLETIYHDDEIVVRGFVFVEECRGFIRRNAVDIFLLFEEDVESITGVWTTRLARTVVDVLPKDSETFDDGLKVSDLLASLGLLRGVAVDDRLVCSLARFALVKVTEYERVRYEGDSK